MKIGVLKKSYILIKSHAFLDSGSTALAKRSARPPLSTSHQEAAVAQLKATTFNRLILHHCSCTPYFHLQGHINHQNLAFLSSALA